MDSRVILESINICKKNLKQKKQDNKIFNKKNLEQKKQATDKLCEFMDISYISNLEVTRYILYYIELNNLQSKVNKKYIILDNKLKNLFDIQDNYEITYFNIQKYIKNLFII